MKRTVHMILIGAAALMVAAAVPACAQPAKEAAVVPAPDFSLQDLQGKALSLSAYKGKVLIVNFWATWCPPCRREVPDFIEAYKELQGEGLEIIGISVDEMTAPELQGWVTKMGINYPVALATPKVVTDYEPGDYIPATIVIDRKGLIRYRQSSMMTKSAIVQLFNKYK